MSDPKPSTSQPDTPQRMRVTACFGHRFRIAAPDALDARHPQARTRGKRMRPVAGDFVTAMPLVGEKDWVIESIEPRDNELARPDARGRREVLAANIELMAIVACPAPAADFFIVDRYLAAARLMHCDALIIWNKSDLGELPPEASAYRKLGYQVIETSATADTGTSELAAALAGKLSILVGQSGVGKSSLINSLGHDDVQRTASISLSNDEGRHTTVTAQLIRLPGDIHVIDSPGVRDYAPSIEDVADVGDGFIEIAEFADRCRFANCRHRAEPGCAVKAGVEDGDIDARRYASFLRLAQLTRQLGKQRR